MLEGCKDILKINDLLASEVERSCYRIGGMWDGPIALGRFADFSRGAALVKRASVALLVSI